MKAEDLKDVTALHGYFVGRMSEYLQSKGRTLVGWDEILESGAKKGAIGMYWRSGRADALIKKASKNGQYLVVTPTAHCYFDFVQSPEQNRFGICETDIETNLNYLVKTLVRDHKVSPNWDWGGAYEDVWEHAKTAWTGTLTLNALIILDAFGRIRR